MTMWQTVLLALFGMLCQSAGVPNPEGVAYLVEQTRGNLDFLANQVTTGNTTGWISRDLPNGALASLVLQQHPSASANCDASTAILLLKKFGNRTDTSFNGQAYPLIWYSYRSCMEEEQRHWLFDVINQSLPATQAQATTQDYSYTNMFLMSTVNAILFGEIVGGPRGDLSASIGYHMFEMWINYTRNAGVHEFTSPTYTHVQVTALYAGYIHAQRDGARSLFGKALDLVWADVCANYFEPKSALSGAHSRDYDTLLGNGIFYLEMYAHGLPNAQPLRCEYFDPHCEGPSEGIKSGTGEPMTVDAISLYNILHPHGYTPSKSLLNLASLGPERVVQNRFLTQEYTANGNSARFGDLYNFVKLGAYSMGSASQDYITRTHDKYFPYPGDKLVNILLGPLSRSPQSHNRPAPAITVQPDWMDSPYGIWAKYPNGMSSLGKASHLALHPGIAQSRNVMLLTLALNTNDVQDNFFLTPKGNLFSSLATNILLPLHADAVCFVFPNSSSAFVTPSTTTPFALDVPVGTTVSVRVGNASMAANVFTVDGAGGQPSRLQLKSDTLGISLGCMRLVAYHFQSALPTNLTANTDTHVRFGALIVADVTSSHGDHLAFVTRVAHARVRSEIVNVSVTKRGDRTTSPDNDEESVFANIHNNNNNNNNNDNNNNNNYSNNNDDDNNNRNNNNTTTTNNNNAVDHTETWVTSATYNSHSLQVVRNLTCSETPELVHNQTLHTRWNCLISRSVNGSNIVPVPLTVNGELFDPL